MSEMNPLSALSEFTALSTVDGRYRDKVLALVPHLSESAFMRNRLFVEAEYLIALSMTSGLKIRRLKASEIDDIRSIYRGFSLEGMRIIKMLEREGYDGIPATNHDVKAMEYYFKLQLKKVSLEDVAEWTHFALTSEDVNSVTQALCLRGALEEAILPALERINKTLKRLAHVESTTPMLARTHGQPASPTTFGKEMAVFARRLERQVGYLKDASIFVKWGGATGNWNAHTVAAPGVDWRALARRFVGSFNLGGSHSVMLELNETTAQIEPHDTFAELFDAMKRIDTILIDFSQDMWRYISDDWVVQRPKEGEIGSSAMPHKVNPIDFEQAEGNLGVANALFEHFSRKLPISRLQRDLSDSTVIRNFGTALGLALIGYAGLERGLKKISTNREAMLAAVIAHPEVLSEAIQTVLRAEGVETPYERLKDLTRGKKVTVGDFRVFIDSLDVSQEVKDRLTDLRPETYIGIAPELAE